MKSTVAFRIACRSGRSWCRLFSETTLRCSTSKEGQFTKSYALSGVGERSKVKIETSTGHSLTTDVPKKMGGQDTSAQPVETLLAAWMGCTQATALFVGRQMPDRINIQRIEFEAIEAFRDERGALTLPITDTPEIPSRIQQVTGTIRIFSKDNEAISSAQMEILREQTEARCPVANMILASGCAIDVDWVSAS